MVSPHFIFILLENYSIVNFLRNSYNQLYETKELEFQSFIMFLQHPYSKFLLFFI